MSDDKFSQNKPFDALNSRGLTGKREYVLGLEQRRDDEALSLLVECLCDESWYLRDEAEAALARIGSSVAPVLRPVLPDSEITSPAFTGCPVTTRSRELWQYAVETPWPWSKMMVPPVK